ncbi:hypothetical protein V2I01_36000 [Micromonospora sp. BRA006-A]|nr:hypothetical protein [Micromonospora sp. BRA006-A]
MTAAAGADPAAFRTRRLRAEHLTGAALVLTATRRQRSACTSLAPAALTRTFTLRQFARLAAEARPAEAGRTRARRCGRRCRPRSAPGAAATRRPPARRTCATPIGGSPADFRRCAEEIERSIRPVLALIATAG